MQKPATVQEMKHFSSTEKPDTKRKLTHPQDCSVSSHWANIIQRPSNCKMPTGALGAEGLPESILGWWRTCWGSPDTVPAHSSHAGLWVEPEWREASAKARHTVAAAPQKQLDPRGPAHAGSRKINSHSETCTSLWLDPRPENRTGLYTSWLPEGLDQRWTINKPILFTCRQVLTASGQGTWILPPLRNIT